MLVIKYSIFVKYIYIMKGIIILFSLAFCATVSAKTYYVAPTGGSDLYPGTISQPWATWQRAFNTAYAGDTVFFRGGIWRPSSKYTSGYAVTSIDPRAGLGHNGTHDNPICFFAYPPDYEAGNYPILDCNNASQASTGNIGLNINVATYLKFKGLTVRNSRMLNPTDNVSGFEMRNCGVITFENCTTHNIGGVGFWLAGYDTLYLTNCDSYNICDSLDVTAPGGDGDAYNITSGGATADTFKIAYLKGCRAWNASDDGFDLSSTKQFDVSNCWSFHNGFQFPLGDGTGIKLAYSHVLADGKRKIHNCIAAHNTHEGFIETNLGDAYYGPRCAYYNNLVYSCEYGFLNSQAVFDCGTGKAHTIIQNNIVYDLTSTYYSLFNVCNSYFEKFVTLDHNNWTGSVRYPYYELNPAFNVTDEDFESLDTAQLRRPRKADGSLPDITFGTLAATSDLIDGGIDVGLPFYGTAPDLGYSEYENIPGTSNKYPDVSITSPTNGSILKNNNITIIASAFDADGSISKVEFFYQDTIKIGETNVYPWTYSWDNPPLGNHSLSAIVTDNQYAKSTSSHVNITVIPDINNTSDYILFPNPNDGIFTIFLTIPLENNNNVTIISLEGKVVFNGTMLADERIKQFDLPFLRPGIYVLLLYSFGITVEQKFIKLN
jgi:hypothetical protein